MKRTNLERRPPRARAAWLVAAFALAGLGACPPPAAHTAGSDARTPLQVATESRSLEELGAYGQAADLLRSLRARVPADGDLELALALDEARAGLIDSAATRLWGPILSAALGDSLPITRHGVYGYHPAGHYIDGGFGGWHWYVARARAEVAATMGRWSEARDAARVAAAARPTAGREWLILCVAAGRAGDLAESAAALDSALFYDPTLPEAHYLSGLNAWRVGQRAKAQASFRRAIELDSTYRAPALALMRSRLPSAGADSLPGYYFGGVGEIALLTSRARPKLEEYVQNDATPELIEAAEIATPAGLKGTFKEGRMELQVLVDARGRIVLHDLPWFERALIPAPLFGIMAEALKRWRFKPAVRMGAPRAAWTTIHLTFMP